MIFAIPGVFRVFGF